MKSILGVLLLILLMPSAYAAELPGDSADGRLHVKQPIRRSPQFVDLDGLLAALIATVNLFVFDRLEFQISSYVSGRQMGPANHPHLPDATQPQQRHLK